MAVPTLKRLLFVEDEPDIQVVARLALEAVGGFQVVICSSGKEALEKAPGFEPDLILLDVMMPGMDGYDAMRAIRKNKKFKSLPIIAVTAKAMKGDREKCIEAGASDYITKPVDVDQLLSLLRVWLYK